MFTFNRKKHGDINDSVIKDLPEGKHNYVLTKISVAPIKSDKTGKRKQIVVELRHSEGANYTVFLEHTPKKMENKDAQENENTRARIAGDTFNSIITSAGYTDDNFTLAKAKTIYNKVFGIRTEVTTNKATKKSYSNIRETVAGGWDEEELDEVKEASAAPAPAAKKTAATKTTRRKKPAPEPEPEPEEEYEEEAYEEEPEEETYEEEAAEPEEEYEGEEEEDPFAV